MTMAQSRNTATAKAIGCATAVNRSCSVPDCWLLLADLRKIVPCAAGGVAPIGQEVDALLRSRVETYILAKSGEGQAWRRQFGPVSLGSSACVPCHTGNHRGRMMEDRDTRRAPAEDPTYSVAARRFHWWTFTFLAIQIPVGLFMVRYGAATDFAAPTDKLYDGHKLLGLAILLLAVARLAYRLVHGAPPDEPTLAPWEKLVSHLTHWAIYVLLILVPLLGWLAISYYGPFEPFGIKLPALAAKDEAKATQTFFLHMVAAYALIVVLAMHVGAALQHYLIKKDGVLRRMLVRAGRLSLKDLT